MKKHIWNYGLHPWQAFFSLCLCASVVNGFTGCAGIQSIPVRLYHAKFVVEKPGMASARVLDSQDREIRMIWKDRAVAAGELDLAWDGRNDQGETLPPGNYQIALSIRRWTLKAVGDFGGLGSSPGRFLNPRGLCVYPQGARLTVAVADTGNQRVQLLTDTGGFLQSAGEFGSAEEKLNQPTDVDWDGQILTVCDSLNHRLARFDGQGIYLGEVRNLTGVQTSPSRQPALNFEEPRNIQKSGGAAFWVSDRGKGILFQVTTTGGILQAYGDPFPLGNEGPFFELDGTLFLQTARNRIQVLPPGGGLGGETRCDPALKSIGGMAASGMGFGVITDSQSGLLYFIDREGKTAGTFEPEGVSRPGALGLWEDHLFLIDNSQSRIFHFRITPIAPSELKQEIEIIHHQDTKTPRKSLLVEIKEKKSFGAGFVLSDHAPLPGESVRITDAGLEKNVEMDGK